MTEIPETLNRLEATPGREQVLRSSPGFHPKAAVSGFERSAVSIQQKTCKYAYNTFQIMPDDVFGLQWALMPVLMTIAGGVGTFAGPILGVFLLIGIFQATSINLPRIHLLFSGTFIIILALWLPHGVMSIIRHRQK